MALTWTLKLKDAMSSAAGKMVASLDRVQAALKKTGKESEKTDGRFRDATGRMREANGRFVEMGLGAKAAAKGFSVAKGLAVNAISAIASKTAELGQMGLAKLFDVAMASAEKDAILAGMSKILGSADKAEAAFGRIAKKAREIGMGTLDAAKQAQGLLAMGFKLEGSTGVLRVLEAGQALKNINPTANVDNVITALSQIQAKGKLTAEELHGQLGDAGVNIGFVYDELAKKLGKSTDEVRKMMSAGKITSDMGIEAVFASIERQGGASLSNLAAMGKGSFTNMLDRLMNLPQEIGTSLNLGKFFGSASGVIDKIIGALTNPQATAFFDSIFNTMGAGLLDKGGGAIEKIIGTLTDPRVASFIGSFMDMASAGLEGFGEGFQAVADVLLSMPEGNMQNLAGTAKVLGQALGGVVAAMLFFGKVSTLVVSGIVDIGIALGGIGVAVWEGIEAAFTWFAELPTRISEWVTGATESASASASELGSSIIDGIVGGIEAGLSAVVDAIVGVANSAIKAGEAALGINSPSKVFERMYMQTGAGAERGVIKSTPQVASASSSMANQAAQAGQRVGRVVNNSGSSSTSTSSNVFYISGAGNPQATANAVADRLRGAVSAYG